MRRAINGKCSFATSKGICYVAGNKAAVDRIDTLCFVDMLHNINPGDPIDLTLCYINSRPAALCSIAY